MSNICLHEILQVLQITYNTDLHNKCYFYFHTAINCEAAASNFEQWEKKKVWFSSEYAKFPTRTHTD